MSNMIFIFFIKNKIKNFENDQQPHLQEYELLYSGKIRGEIKVCIVHFLQFGEFSFFTCCSLEFTPPHH